MILHSPGDVAFTLFGFPVYFYGIILACACLIAVCVARFLYSKIYKDGKGDFIWDVSPFVVILGIIGARLYYCLVNLDYYFFHPVEVLNFREGGLSIHGGIIAGIIGLYIASKKYNISFLRLLDVFAAGTVLAQAFGRWGNFFNNEAFGLPFDGFLKLYVPPAFRPEGFENFPYYHPAFLYESAADFLIFLILLVVLKNFGVKIEGLTLCLYLMLYSLIRFFIEGIRLDSALNVGNLHIAQIMSAGIFIFAFALGIYLAARSLSSKVD